jgi:hypothetical protein
MGGRSNPESARNGQIRVRNKRKRKNRGNRNLFCSLKAYLPQRKGERTLRKMAVSRMVERVSTQHLQGIYESL